MARLRSRGRESVSCYRVIDLLFEGEGQLSHLCAMQGLEGLKERLLRLERQAALQEGQGECRAHRADHREIHHRSTETYGYLRVHAELRALGERCKRKRVARLMRKDGLRGCMRGRRRKHTTRQDPLAVPPRTSWRGTFVPPPPRRLWTADIIYLPTDEGFLYLAFILDVYSRKVVGWSMASHLRSELVAAALEMAIRRGNPSTGLIHHSDRGAQYTALSFGKRLEQCRNRSL